MSSRRQQAGPTGDAHPPRKRAVNLRLLLTTLVVLGISCPLAIWWYHRQVQRTAGALLVRADAFEKEQEWLEAVNALQRYLILQPDDSPVQIRLVENFAKAADTVRAKQRLIRFLYEALGIEPERTDLRLQLAENLLQLGQFAAAEEEAREAAADETGDTAAARRVIALSLYARARPGGVVTPKKAATELDRALADQPGDIELASATADFLRKHPNSLEDKVVDSATYADQIMDKMVAANPGNPDAFVARYRYSQRHAPAAARDVDIETALDLDPRQVEALLTAANQALIDSGSEGRDEAEVHLRQVIKSEPEDPRGYLGLAQLLSQNGDHEEAARILRQGRRAVGADDPNLLSSLVAVLVDSNELDTAENHVSELDQIIRDRLPQLPVNARRPLQNRLRLLRARIALGRSQWKSAIADLKAIVAVSELEDAELRSPDVRQALFLLGQAMAAQNQWDMAARYCSRLANQMPQQADLWRRAAQAYLQAGQPDDAISCLERFLQASPPTEEILVDLVRAHLRRQLRRPRSEQNWAEFLSALENAKEQTPDRWELALAEANYLLASDTDDDRQRALALLRTSEDQFAQEALFCRGLVLAYGQLGELEDAERALERFEALEPSPVNRASLRTSFLIQTKRLDEADEALVRLVPGLNEQERLQIEQLRVSIAVSAGRVDAAKEQITKLINASPRDEGLLKLGVGVALWAKDFQAAKDWEVSLSGLNLVNDFEFRIFRVRRLLAQYADLEGPDRDDLTRLIEVIRTEQPRSFAVVALAARHAELRRETKQAIADYQMAVDLGDGRPSTLERLVSLLYSENRLSEADEYLSRLATVRPDNPHVDSMAMLVAVQRDRPEEALEIAKAAVERNPEDVMRRVWLGNLLSVRGEEDEAEQVFRAAVEQFPKDARAWSGLFSLLVRTERHDEARQVLQAMTDQSDWPGATRHFVTAQGYEMLGDAGQARKSYEAAIQSAPKNAAIRLRFVRLLLSVDVSAARLQLEEILELDPTNDEARRRLATLLSSSGDDKDWNRALQLLQGKGAGASAAGDDRLRAVLLGRRGRTRKERLDGLEDARKILVNQLERTGADAEDFDRILLAGIYEQEARLREDLAGLEAAREQLRHVVDRAEPQANYLVLYIQFLLRQIGSPLLSAENLTGVRDVRAAYLSDARLRLGELQDAQEREEAPRETLVSLGLRVGLLKAEDRIDDAAARIGEFAEQNEPEIVEDVERSRLYLGVGNLYSSIGRDAEAETWYRQLTSIAPGAYVLLVQSLSRQGKAQDALEVCLQAFQKNPSPESATLIAKLLTSSELESQTNDNAEAVISSAIDDHGDHVELLLSVAVLRVNQGDSDEAIRLFRRVLELEPRHTLALNNLATLLAERPNQFAEASECIEKAIAIAGRLPALLDTQGTIFLRSGAPEKAVSCLEEATAGRVTDPRYYFHLAAAYLEVGKTDTARDAFEEARELGLAGSILTAGDQELFIHLKQELLPEISSN